MCFFIDESPQWGAEVKTCAAENITRYVFVKNWPCLQSEPRRSKSLSNRQSDTEQEEAWIQMSLI